LGVAVAGDITGTLGATVIASGVVTNAAIAGNAVDGTKISLNSEALGDMMYYDGTDWVRLAAGTSGQLLKANGAAAPTWISQSTLDGSVLTNLNASQLASGTVPSGPRFRAYSG